MIEDHLVLIPADDPVKLEHVREIRLDLIPGAVTTNNDVFGHQDNRSRAGEHCILNSRSLRHDDLDDGRLVDLEQGKSVKSAMPGARF